MRNNTHITIPINSDIYSMSNSDVIRHTILAMLPAARARSQLGNGGIDASTKLLSVGRAAASCSTRSASTSRLASHWGAWLVRLTLRAGEASDAARRRGHFETEASMHCLTLPILG